MSDGTTDLPNSDAQTRISRLITLLIDSPFPPFMQFRKSCEHLLYLDVKLSGIPLLATRAYPSVDHSDSLIPTIMVNTGHPSRACKLCRERRIKCDETKPTCLKCAKAKRVCPGYRDSFEINLRDETRTTIRKAKTAALKKAAREGRSIDGAAVAEAMLGSADAGAIDWSLVTSTSTIQPAQYSASAQRRRRAVSDTAVLAGGWYMMEGDSVPRSVNTPIEQQALCYFLSNYVLAPPLGVGRGVMTFFLPLIESPAYKTSPMRAAFLATSLAALAGRPNSRSIFRLAHMWYSKALSELTVLMRDDKNRTDNLMLAATILLGFYEGLASETVLGEVFTHLNGGIALVRERGKELQETPAGLGMFEFIRVAAVRYLRLFYSPIMTDFSRSANIPSSRMLRRRRSTGGSARPCATALATTPSCSTRRQH